MPTTKKEKGSEPKKEERENKRKSTITQGRQILSWGSECYHLSFLKYAEPPELCIAEMLLTLGQLSFATELDRG